MKYYKKLVGKKCYLSPCHIEDAQQWTEWFNDLEVAIPLGDEAYTPFSQEKSQAMVNDVISNQEHVFSIVDFEHDILLGRCLLFAIDWIDRRAMVGIVLGEKAYWNKGYGQDAMRLLLDYAFNLLNLNSIMLGTFSFNERGIHCYKKIGFKEIGRRRQFRILGDKKFDLILMDILAEEFKSPYVSKFLT